MNTKICVIRSYTTFLLLINEVHSRANTQIVSKSEGGIVHLVVLEGRTVLSGKLRIFQSSHLLLLVCLRNCLWAFFGHLVIRRRTAHYWIETCCAIHTLQMASILGLEVCKCWSTALMMELRPLIFQKSVSNLLLRRIEAKAFQILPPRIFRNLKYLQKLIELDNILRKNRFDPLC